MFSLRGCQPHNPSVNADLRKLRLLGPLPLRSTSLWKPSHAVTLVVGSVLQPLRTPAGAHRCGSLRRALVSNTGELMPHASVSHGEHPRVWVPILAAPENLDLCFIRHAFSPYQQMTPNPTFEPTAFSGGSTPRYASLQLRLLPLAPFPVLLRQVCSPYLVLRLRHRLRQLLECQRPGCALHFLPSLHLRLSAAPQLRQRRQSNPRPHRAGQWHTLFPTPPQTPRGRRDSRCIRAPTPIARRLLPCHRAA